MKVLQFLLLFVFTGAIAQAQTQDTSRNRMPRRDMFEGLNLTKDQQDKIKVIQDKQREEMQAIRDNNQLSQDQKREQSQTLRKKYNEQIEALLTAEQKEKYKAKQKEMEEQMQRRRNGGGPGGQGGGNNQ
jgi:Spy/CpxP family protein refolding chaperone